MSPKKLTDLSATKQWLVKQQLNALLSLLTVLSLFATGITYASDVPELDCVIEPSEIVDIGSATAGVLESVGFDRGDSVIKNEVIARLESNTEEAAAELARVRSTFTTGIELRRASAEFFERNQRRSNQLKKQNAISSQQLDQLDTESRVAELQVRQEEDNNKLARLEYRRAQQALKRRAIKSPINGVVIDRFKSVGEYVEDTAIMRVAQLDPLFVETIIPVTHMGKIKPGMQAKVTPVVPGQEPRYAVVTRIDRVADAASGTFGVRLELDNPKGTMVSGVRCALEFDASRPVVALGPDKRPKALQRTNAKREKHLGSPITSDDKTVASVTTGTMNTSSTTINDNSPAHCFEAGPWTSLSIADDIVARLDDNHQTVSIREVPGEHPGQFFVLTRTTKDKEDAFNLINKLHAQGIHDTHLLRRGDNAGKISLGLYANQASAEKYAARLASLGLVVTVTPRSQTTLWLNIASAEATDVNSIRKLLSHDAPQRVRSVPCETLQAAVQ